MVSDKKILKDFFCCHGNQSFWNNLSRNSEEEYGRNNISVKFHQNRKVVSEKMFKEKVNGQMHRRTHGCTHDRPRHKFAGLWPVELIKVHKEMLHAKNQSSIPSSFREEEFWSWSFLFLCSNLWPPTHPQCGVSFDPRGIDTWIQLIKVHRRCYIPNIKALSPPVSEKKNFEVGLLGSFVPTCDHRGETSFDPPAYMTWTNLIEVHTEMLTTRYQNSTPSAWDKNILKLVFFGPVFQLVIPQGGAQFWPPQGGFMTSYEQT